MVYKKVDNNQSAIVESLRRLPGVTVALKHDDILVGYKGRTYWYEIKNPDAVSKKTGKIRDSEKKKSQKVLEAGWTGHYKIVSSVMEIANDIDPAYITER